MKRKTLIKRGRGLRMKLPHCDLDWLSHGDFTTSKGLAFGVATFARGKGHGRHIHPNAEEIIHVVNGRSRQTVGRRSFPMQAGDTVFIPQNEVHSTRNLGPGKLVIQVIFSSSRPQTVDLD